MATGKALDGKPYAGNPHVRFDEGEVAPAAKPRRGSLLYKKLMMIGGAVVAILSIEAKASTVAYWPLAGENGVRTTDSTAFGNEGSGGTMDAVPVTISAWYGELQNTESHSRVADYYKYFPIGTNAFPAAFGVYDPTAKLNHSASTGLDFDSYRQNWWSGKSIATNPGVLRVVDPDAIKLSTFTVEMFVKPDPAKKSLYQTFAAMPLQTVSSGNAGSESWALMITDNQKLYLGCATVDEDGNQTARKTYISSVASPQLFDGRWHHIAFSVDGTSLKIYFDYALVYSTTIDYEIQYAADGDLFIGGSTHVTYSYYGSMAHFRVSDEALTSDKFLHFTRTTRAADVADDVLLHINFEAVDGISTNNVFFNQAATGSAVHLSATNSAGVVGYTKFSPDVYTNKLYSSRRASIASDNLLSWNRTGNSNGEPCVEWLPSEDVFAESSFTVEMFVKTSTFNAWTHLFKRRLDNNNNGNQIWIGGLSSINQIKFELNNGPSAITDTTGTIKNGAWHHIAVVYDKDSRSLSYYRDWELIKTSTKESAVSVTSVQTKPIEIGGSPLSGTYAIFNGFIDEVRITKRALGVKEFLTPERANGLIIIFQ